MTLATARLNGDRALTPWSGLRPVAMASIWRRGWRLVGEHPRLVRHIAKRAWWLDPDDAAQESALCLARSGYRYRPTGGATLSTYFQRTQPRPRANRVRELRRTVYLNEPLQHHARRYGDDVPWSATLADVLPAPDADAERESSTDIEAARQAMTTLPARLQTCLTMWMDGTPWREIGTKLGVSGSRAQQMRQQALEKLREVLFPAAPPPPPVVKDAPWVWRSYYRGVRDGVRLGQTPPPSQPRPAPLTGVGSLGQLVPRLERRYGHLVAEAPAPAAKPAMPPTPSTITWQQHEWGIGSAPVPKYVGPFSVDVYRDVAVFERQVLRSVGFGRHTVDHVAALNGLPPWVVEAIVDRAVENRLAFRIEPNWFVVSGVIP